MDWLYLFCLRTLSWWMLWHVLAFRQPFDRFSFSGNYVHFRHSGVVVNVVNVIDSDSQSCGCGWLRQLEESH